MNTAPNPSPPTLPLPQHRRGFLRRHWGKLCLLAIYTTFNCPMPFYSAAWKMDALQLEKEIMDPSIDLGFRTPMRIRMLSSLQRNYSLAEMNRREIIALLGHPDSTGSADMWGRDSLVAPGDSVMVYNLGEENIFSGFSGGGPGYWKEFQIEVGPDDKVRKVSLYDWGS